ncbi:MAG: 3'(2'),5'-bisphosphate nucleotidase CysQ, partial [Actinomycetota bacterium]|nr:3'(2'),5'-bisphosphate nucleotidase CysQ [Actinomycetota bacterium]
MTWSADSTLAVAAAEHGGRVLLQVRSRSAGQNSKAVGAEGDRAAHAAIVAVLSEACPADAILSEEAADDQARL